MNKTYEEILSEYGVLHTTVLGTSMMPLLREKKDIIEVRTVQGDFRKYDAVLFRRHGVSGRGKYVLHRILKVLPDNRYWIVGDNCTAGETVERENILGQMTCFWKNGREVKLSSFGYRTYMALWARPYRFRFAVLTGKRFVRRAVSFVLRRLRKASQKR